MKLREGFKIQKKSMNYFILGIDPPPLPGSMNKFTLIHPKSEKIFFAFLDELDHSKHFLKCPSKSVTFDAFPKVDILTEDLKFSNLEKKSIYINN